MPFDFACTDWWDRLKTGRPPIADLPVNRATAGRAVAIFDSLRLPDVPGQPTMAEGAGDWLREIVATTFGVLNPDGTRAIHELFVLVPKKNSKTTSAAALALTFLLLNTRPNADLLIVAPTQKIAETAFLQAKGMIEADPPDEDSGRRYLADRFHVQDHKSTIKDMVTGARLMIRTFDAKVLTGVKPIFVLVDETHELGKIAYAADVFRQIRGGLAPFPEALLVQITTQSDREPAGVFKTELAYARGVRDGRVTEGVQLLPVLYEFPAELQADEDKPWLNPALWHLVTPNLGRSIQLDALVKLYHRAQEDGPEEVQGWATQHLNVEVGVALHGDRWPGAVFWAQRADADVTSLEALVAACDVITIGGDWGGADDLAALAFIGRLRTSRHWRIWGRAWARPIVLERRKGIAAHLRGFEKDGDLRIVADPHQVAAEAAELCALVRDAGRLPEKDGIGLDVAGIALLVDELEARGMGAPLVVGVSQDWRLQAASQTLATRLEAGTCRHAGQPVLSWAVGNAKQELRGSTYRITKAASGAGKIDPLAAALNAAQLMLRNPVASAGLVLSIPDTYEVA